MPQGEPDLPPEYTASEVAILMEATVVLGRQKANSHTNRWQAFMTLVEHLEAEEVADRQDVLDYARKQGHIC